jgi:ribulose-phosphate 3-epimerase
MSGVKIAPSIASADQSRLGWAIQEAERSGADLIHLDIEDGVFIPNLTFGPTTIKHLRPLTSLPFDVHLEVDQPEVYLEQVVDAGADVVTVQVEALRYPYRALSILHSLGVKAGFAFVAATPVDVLIPVLDHIDIVHLMTAEPNGSGAAFIPGILEKIRSVKSMIGGRSIEIEVDGGINPENAGAVVEAGATILVAGRAVWGAANLTDGIQNLRKAAGELGSSP